MGIISRGFSGRRSAADVKLPPGQYLTTDFPVLSAGPTPHVPLDRWEFVIDDGTNVLRRWDWESFRALPTETFTVDLHCVTRWSKLGTSWEGVSLDTMLADVKTDASHAMVRSYGDYTTNVPLKDLRNGQAWIAFRFDNKDQNQAIPKRLGGVRERWCAACVLGSRRRNQLRARPGVLSHGRDSHSGCSRCCSAHDSVL